MKKEIIICKKRPDHPYPWRNGLVDGGRETHNLNDDILDGIRNSYDLYIFSSSDSELLNSLNDKEIDLLIAQEGLI